MSALAHALGEVALLDGEPAEAARQFERGASLLADVGAPFERAETQRRARAALVAAGQHAEAVERLVAAHRTARRLGARPLAAKLAADLAALGEPRRAPSRPPGARPSSRNGGLTRREVEVVRLVAVGQTNREIATRAVPQPAHGRHARAEHPDEARLPIARRRRPPRDRARPRRVAADGLIPEALRRAASGAFGQPNTHSCGYRARPSSSPASRSSSRRREQHSQPRASCILDVTDPGNDRTGREEGRRDGPAERG